MFEFASIELKNFARSPRGTVAWFFLNEKTTLAKAQVSIQSYFNKAEGKVTTRGMFLVDPTTNTTQRVIRAVATKAGRPAKPRGRKAA